MVIDIVWIVDNYVDKLLISLWYQNDITFRTRSLSSIFTWQNIDLDYCKCQVILLYIPHSCIASSIFTWHVSYNPSCKNVHYPSYIKKHTIILYYYSMFIIWSQGHSLHYRLDAAFHLSGYVFHSHLPYIFHYFHIFFIFFTTFYFDTHFDKTQ